MTRVAVIGTGAAGLATAGWLAEGGHSVLIANRGPRGLAEIRGQGGIRVERAGTSAVIAPVQVAASIVDAVERSKVVVLAVGGGGEDRLLRDLETHLEAVELIVVMSGRAGAGAACAQVLESFSGGVPVLAELAFPFVASEERAGAVCILGQKSWAAMTCTPEHCWEMTLSTVRAMFAIEVELCQPLWSCLHCIPGLIVPLIAISNAGLIARGEEFAFYQEGGYPEFDRLVDAVDCERMALGERLGLSTLSSVNWFNRTYDLNCSLVSEVLATNRSYERRMAPASLRHRYLTDHVPLCVVPLVRLGLRVGVETPFLDSVAMFASVLVGRDLSTLGLARAGWIPALLASDSGPHRLEEMSVNDVG